MGDKSGIEWTDATWNPIRGCSRVSEGCRHCYAERLAIRQASGAYRGLIAAGPRWTGEVRFVEEALTLPLRWKKPRLVFVNSMSDLFHERVERRWLDRIFGVMELAQQHTFQILTKRPEIMRKYLSERWGARPWGEEPTPRSHIHLGVSVEDQATADERIPLLLQTPASVRWVSYEPALWPVDFVPGWRSWLIDRVCVGCGRRRPTEEYSRARWGSTEPWDCPTCGHPAYKQARALDWLVIGGESGPGARPFDLAWARSAIAQCKVAGVPVFVKQLGANPFDSDRTASGRSETVCLRDRKGGDPSEWPEDLRVREFPIARRLGAAEHRKG